MGLFPTTSLDLAKRARASWTRAKIAGFAAIRTVTDPDKFRAIELPVFDRITLYPSGRTHREPDW